MSRPLDEVLAAARAPSQAAPSPSPERNGPTGPPGSWR